MELSERLTKGKTGHTGGQLLIQLQWVPTVLVLATMATWGQQATAGIRLALSTVVLYLAFKVAAAIKQQNLWSEMTLEGWFWYWTAWPGMRLTGFTKAADEVDSSWLRRGIVGIVSGVTILAGTAVLASTNYVQLSDWVIGWLTIIGILASIHFGYADVLSWLLRRRGFKTRRLFVKPERSKTLNEFWSKRWNLAFVEMDHLLFMRPLRRISKRWAPLLMLLLSGVFHELALSYPAGGGWGLPMIYFGVHGVGMNIERTSWFRRLDDRIKPWWTRILVLAPAGLVFHQPFRDALPLQLMNQIVNQLKDIL